jgi:hypothetical protein
LLACHITQLATHHLSACQAACSSASPEQAAHALTEGLGKALLLRFEDTSEACRELAVGCFQQLLVKGEDATLHLLPYAMPVLEERLQLQEVCSIWCSSSSPQLPPKKRVEVGGI